MKKKKKKVQYIPVEIANTILRCLPEVSQVRFKIVCKEWRSIINGMLKLDALYIHPDPYPYRLPCAIPLCLMSKTSTTTTSYTIHAKTIDVDLNNFSVRHTHPNPYTFRHKLPFFSMSKTMDVELNNFSVRHTHCNGFVIRRNCTYTKFALWSPFSGERIELPSGYYDYVLGYDLKSNDYKLVARQGFFSETPIIFSFKSQAWYYFVDFPIRIACCSPVFANDAFYWIGKKGQQKVMISLHLSTETLTQFPVPPCCSAWKYISVSPYSFEGCLFLFCSHHDELKKDAELNLWILKDCETGNGKYWNKLITLARPMSNSRHCTHPVAYVKSKEQFVIRYDDKFMWFDLKNNKCLKTVTIEAIGTASCKVLPVSHGWFSENHENGLKLDIKTSLCLDSSTGFQLL